MEQILYILAGICFAYFVVVAIYTRMASKFHLIWIAIGMICLLLGKIISMEGTGQIIISHGIQIAFRIILCVSLVIFVYVEGLIVVTGKQNPQQDAKYMIVLGAHVYGTRISKSLQLRLDTAAEYLKKHPNTIVILSGGKGEGEDITEAEAMEQYLLKKGIAKKQIRLEEKSVNTDQNIAFSKNFMSNEKDEVVVVSNDFHIYRALGICKKQGLSNVSGLGAKSVWIMVPSYYLREGMAVIKYKLCGQI